jgi:hypothetical protein
MKTIKLISIIAILFLSITLIYALSFSELNKQASAGELTNEQLNDYQKRGNINTFQKYYLSTLNYYNKANNLYQDEGFEGVKEYSKSQSKEILGFKVPVKDFFQYFLFGFLAGILIWLTYRIKELIRAFNSGIISKEEMYMKDDPLRWLNLVGGAWWKSIILGALLGVLMQIPIINRIIFIITFGPITNFITYPIILALEIGFLPTLIDYFTIKRLETKYMKGIETAGRLRTQGERRQ